MPLGPLFFICLLLPVLTVFRKNSNFFFLTFLHPQSRPGQSFPEYRVKSECHSVQESCAYNTQKSINSLVLTKIKLL